MTTKANTYREIYHIEVCPLTLISRRALFHIAASQEQLYASILPYTEPSNLKYRLQSSENPPIAVHAYPLVPTSVAFPLLSTAPASVVPGKRVHVDPHILSATNIAYSKSLAFLRRSIGPCFDLEKVWGQHIHYVGNESGPNCMGLTSKRNLALGILQVGFCLYACAYNPDEALARDNVHNGELGPSSQFCDSDRLFKGGPALC